MARLPRSHRLRFARIKKSEAQRDFALAESAFAFVECALCCLEGHRA
jgi:hypothetical protein